MIPLNSDDFWWHLRTGQIILEKGLPEEDPFNYTTTGDDQKDEGRIHFILTQYWLSQVLYAACFNLFGMKGIILLRAVIYTLIGLAALTLIRIKRRDAPLLFMPITLPFLVLAMRTVLEDSDRPQVFIFLFSMITLVIIEWAVNRKSGPLLMLNIPVIWLASNMHAGYTVIAIFLASYAICSFFELRLKPLMKWFVISSSLAFIATYLNPNHWDAFIQAGKLSKTSILYNQTMEYKSPFDILPSVIFNHGWLSYWFLILISAPAVLFFLKKGRFSWSLILAGTLLASLTYMRFAGFFIPIGASLGAVFLREVISGKVPVRLLLVSAVSIALTLLIIFPYHSNRFDIKTVYWDMIFPVSAAEFVANEKPPQPLFNELNYGSYLDWKLWPEYKTFIDTRVLTRKAYLEYQQIMAGSPTGMELIREYGIRTVLTRAINPISGEIFPLVRKLYEGDEWSLVYRDGQSLIFTKKGFYPKELPKKEVYHEVLAEIGYWGPLHSWGRGYLASRKEALQRL